MTTDITLIKKEVEEHLKDKETLKTLVATTFKNLSEQVVKQAIVEGMLRGFTFKDFLQKDIYAVPFKDGYSLVISIDRARKIGMRSGVIGKSEPEFTYNDDGSIESCKVTIKRKVGEDVGEFTERVFLSEYTTGRNLWVSKPRTMIAKVAEMHALRMACPEELSHIYDEDELSAEQVKKPAQNIDKIIDDGKAKLDAATTLDELAIAWSNLPPDAKAALRDYKDTLKKKYASA